MALPLGPKALTAARIVIVLWSLGAVAGCAFYFGYGSALWLVVLGAVTGWRPWLGVSAFFAAVSLDVAKPVLGGIVVSLSELEFAVVLLGWLSAVLPRLDSCDWRALKWGSPFIGAVLLSALVNNKPYEIPFHLLRASELTVAVFLASNAIQRDESRSHFRWVLAIAAAFYALNGLLQFPSVRGWRIYSYFNNPNQFAGYLNLLLPPVLVLFFATAKRKTRILWGALLALIALSAMAAQSRAAILAGALGAGLLWFLHYGAGLGKFWRQPLLHAGRYLRRSALPLAVTLALTAAFAGWLFETQPTTVSSAWKLFGQREVFSQRRPYLRVGWEVWKNHFLVGVGPGNYAKSLDGYSDLLNELSRRLPPHSEFPRVIRVHTHNLYLQLGVNYGLLGLLGFLLLVLRLWWEFYRRQSESQWHRAGLGVLTAFLIHNVFDVTFPSLALETGLLLGTLLPGSIRLREERPA